MDDVLGTENIRLVPRVVKSDDEQRLRAVRVWLDFTVRDYVKIRFEDLIKEAKEYFRRDSIKDLADLNLHECQCFGTYLVENKEQIRIKYPYWK